MSHRIQIEVRACECDMRPEPHFHTGPYEVVPWDVFVKSLTRYPEAYTISAKAAPPPKAGES